MNSVSDICQPKLNVLLCGEHKNNVVDGPHCICGHIEDTRYFLFVCHQFTDLRQDLLNSVSDICQPILNVLLCGDILLYN